MTKLACINGKAKRMLLIIEPWAEEYWIELGTSVGDQAKTDLRSSSLRPG